VIIKYRSIKGKGDLKGILCIIDSALDYDILNLADNTIWIIRYRGRLSRNSESTIWGLESQKTIRREWSENDKRRQGGFKRDFVHN